ncbi:MAG: carbohydrate binding family 9 domain-containing protein [Candidatus Aminicenantes bacterium]|nr:carbohydrate binding family 9 domain-containing protein [Candidatus Aminicenantes bacterium]
MKKKLVLVVLFLFPFVLLAQDSEQTEQKVVQAIRADEPIKIDGVLNEQVWQGAGYSEFVQSDPIDGAQPTEKTTVWVAYDDRSLYVAARLYDSQPESIVSRLGRRDDLVDSDWFEFAVDPYYDRLTGFQFRVNPAASIIDETLYNDSWSDSSWDGVWDWAARVDEQGWAVEIRIPYNQLRFPKKEEYVWGVNFRRTIKRKNEKDGFIWIPKEDRGYVSHFARLEGIKGINPGRHIEFLPYAVAQAEYTPAESGNPYATGKNYFGNTGVDLKVGLKSNLTLDAAINPDFGQVEVDPAVINLTAYETFYQERRPFFIEGSSIFNFGYGGATSFSSINWWEPNFFYSRRIGRAPQGYVSQSGYVNFPDRSTILGAAKISGKIGSGWNIGFINALTAREYAEIDSGGERFREEVEPFSYYGVLRVQKEFNESNQGFGFITTSVLRDLKSDNLQDILNQNAFSLAFDGWTFLDKNKTWVITGWMGGTRVAGSQADILRLQQAPQHYFQRPDAAHVELDEDATSLSGWAGRIYLNKEKGNFIFNAAVGAISPGFDTNDAGFHSRGDVVNSHLMFGYQSLHPGKVFRNWRIILAPYRNYDFGGNKFDNGYLLLASAQFLNYWGVELMTGYKPPAWNNDLTRGGPLMKSPAYRHGNLSIYSDSRKPVVLSMNSEYSENTAGSFGWSNGVSLRWKPRSNISISFGPSYSFRRSIFQWITRVKDPLMVDTYGTRYIFSDIDQRTFSTSIRLNWTFTPKLSFQLYTQILLGVGDYERFKELARARSYDFNIFGQEQSTISYADDMYTVDPDGWGSAPSFSFHNPDFNLKSLRGTAVLRWEYLPGSTLYFVWTQNRAGYANPGDFNFSRDIGDVFSAPGDNIFLIKISYRWFM